MFFCAVSFTVHLLCSSGGGRVRGCFRYSMRRGVTEHFRILVGGSISPSSAGRLFVKTDFAVPGGIMVLQPYSRIWGLLKSL
jgi:hypothetical protein